MNRKSENPVCWLSFACFVFILLVVEMEKEIVLPAIPHVMEAFQENYTVAQMILSVNLLGFSLSCLTCYSLVKAFNYQIVMCLSYLGFNIGSVLTCTDSSLLTLVVGRFLQGVSGGHLFIIIFALLPIKYEKEKAERLLGFINGIICLTTGLAPLIGILLIESMNWQACFLCVSFLSVIATLGLPWAQKMGRQVSIPPSEVSLVKSCRKILGSPQFLTSASVPSLMLSCYLVYIAYAPFLFQKALAEYNGHLLYTVSQMGIMFGFAGFCFIAERVCRRYGSCKVERISSCLSIFCGLILAQLIVSQHQHPYLIVASSILTFSFQGIPFNNAMARTVRIFENLETQASSLAMFFKLFFSSVFLWGASLVSEDPKIGTMVMMTILFLLTLVPTFSKYMHQEKPTSSALPCL